jgi:hypothetical protein
MLLFGAGISSKSDPDTKFAKDSHFKGSHFKWPYSKYRRALHRCQPRVAIVAHPRKCRSCPVHRGAAPGLGRVSAQNRPQVAPKTQVDPARGDSGWSPGQALIEFDLR